MAMRQDVAKRVGTSRKYGQLTAENPDQSCFVGACSNASLVLKKRLSSFQKMILEKAVDRSQPFRRPHEGSAFERRWRSPLG
jgi:hypothetical protein